MVSREKLEEQFDIYCPEYANYIMDNCGGERLICNGDTLLNAMEDNYLYEEFIDYMSSASEK